MKYHSVFYHICSVSLDFGVTFWRFDPYKTCYFRKLEVDFANFGMEYFIFNQLELLQIAYSLKDKGMWYLYLFDRFLNT